MGFGSLRCALGFHAGILRTAKAETVTADYAVRFLACHRCGDLVALDIEPYHELEDRIYNGGRP